MSTPALSAFSAGAEGYRWHLPEPAEVDVYADGIAFNTFTLATDDGPMTVVSSSRGIHPRSGGST